MHSRLLVSGLPRSLPPLPRSPAPPCLPCVEGRQRAAPHSSEFPPTTTPLQTLHMDKWGPACVSGTNQERYFLLVVDDYSRYTTFFPLCQQGGRHWGGEFSFGLLAEFCRDEGICQTFTLPPSPQQNGIAEHRIGLTPSLEVLVLEVLNLPELVVLLVLEVLLEVLGVLELLALEVLVLLVLELLELLVLVVLVLELLELSEPVVLVVLEVLLEVLALVLLVLEALELEKLGVLELLALEVLVLLVLELLVLEVLILEVLELSGLMVLLVVEVLPELLALEVLVLLMLEVLLVLEALELEVLESQPQLLPGSPLPAPIPHTEVTESLTERPQRDYELHSLDFSTAFLQGNLHEEIWLRRPPGFIGSFPAGTQWSLWQPVYGLRQAPRKWHDTLRTALAALGFAPSTADPSLFLCTDTTLPPFYVLVYVDDLVFATADTEALALVKVELQERHTCSYRGELRSYLGLQITRDRARRTITLTQSHMVHQVLQLFGFQ
ncbi:unnamed protein product [Closterium sp. NIES-65]|nr:unnamed protein product [Closterium sp. NIES-65]